MRFLVAAIAAVVLAVTGVASLPCVDPGQTSVSVSSDTNSTCITFCTEHNVCTPTPNHLTDIYFTEFGGQIPDVFKVSVMVTDAGAASTATFGSPVPVASLPGNTDGIVGYQANSGKVLYIANGGVINVLSNLAGPIHTTNFDFCSGFGAYHLAVVLTKTGGSPKLYGVDIFSNRLCRHDISMADGMLSNPTEISLVDANNSPKKITTLLETPTGFMYTLDSACCTGSSGEYGNAQFSNDLATLTLSPINNDAKCFHSGQYDPFSGTILTWGNNHICQWTTGSNTPSTLVLGQGNQFDQGAVDGLGHLFIADNNLGHVWYVLYADTGLIGAASTATGNALDQVDMDDIAPLIGGGAVC